MSDTQQDAPGSSRTLLSIAGIGCGIVLVLILVVSIAGFMFRDTIRDYAADQVYATIEQGLEETDLDPAEKSEVLAELARLRRGVQADKVSFVELGDFAKTAVNSPLLAVIVMRSGAKWIRLDPDFPEEEKQAALLTLDRYLRGRVEETFDHGDDIALAETIGDVDEQGNVNFNDKPNTAQLRLLVASTEAKLEGTEIPMEPYEVDISLLLQELIDPLLK